MQGILYEEPSVWQFLFITCLLGGGAAWMNFHAMPTLSQKAYFADFPALVTPIRNGLALHRGNDQAPFFGLQLNRDARS